jgi:peptidoglycan hydrolase CwlO-like protein
MTIQQEKSIKVPVWLFSTAMPILISAISYFVVTSNSNARSQVQIQQLQAEISELKANKTDIKVFELLQAQMNRIEGKLDSYMKNK